MKEKILKVLNEEIDMYYHSTLFASETDKAIFEKKIEELTEIYNAIEKNYND